ncbi:hypothetical protein ABZP36_019203 [Zizania latifolia]
MAARHSATLASPCTSLGPRCSSTASSASRAARGHRPSQAAAASGSTPLPRSPTPTPSGPWRTSTGRFTPSTESPKSPSPNTTLSHACSVAYSPSRFLSFFFLSLDCNRNIGSGLLPFTEVVVCPTATGCVEVVGCVTSQELASWEHVPQSVRLEALTDFCWLCENPQKLVVPFEMRGYQGVYNLERRIYEGAVRGLSPVQGPLPVKFPLPDPSNTLSLKPGALKFDPSKSSSALEKTKSPSVTAAIAGARAAATQYSRKDHNVATSSPTQGYRQNRADGSPGNETPPSIVQNRPPYLQDQSIGHNTPSFLHNQNLPSVVHNNIPNLKNQILPSSVHTSHPNSQNQRLPFTFQETPTHLRNQNLPANALNRGSLSQYQSPSSVVQHGPSYLQNQNSEPRRSPRLQNGAPSRLVAVALRGLKQSGVSERGAQSVPKS